MIAIDWPVGEVNKDDWKDVYNYNNCIEDSPGQQSLTTSNMTAAFKDHGEDICLFMSTGRYCDEEIYIMDFKIDGMYKRSSLTLRQLREDRGRIQD